MQSVLRTFLLRSHYEDHVRAVRSICSVIIHQGVRWTSVLCLKGMEVFYPGTEGKCLTHRVIKSML